MTIEEVLNADPAVLEKMTDAECLKYWEPYLKITRPELAERPLTTNNKRSVQAAGAQSMLQQRRNKAQSILAGLGIEIDL